MTTRARLLAILKEPDRYFWRVHNETLLDVFDGQSTRIGEVSIATGEYLPAKALCADLNARHRLKRLCEEIAGEMHDLSSMNAIRALGEDDEHS